MQVRQKKRIYCKLEREHCYRREYATLRSFAKYRLIPMPGPMGLYGSDKYGSDKLLSARVTVDTFFLKKVDVVRLVVSSLS